MISINVRTAGLQKDSITTKMVQNGGYRCSRIKQKYDLYLSAPFITKIKLPMKPKHHRWREVSAVGGKHRAWKCIDCGATKTQEAYLTRTNHKGLKLLYAKDGKRYEIAPACREVFPETPTKARPLPAHYFHYNVLLEAMLGSVTSFSSDEYAVRLGHAETIGYVKNLRTDGPKLYGDLVLSISVTGMFPEIRIQVLEHEVLHGAVKSITKGLLLSIGIVQTTDPLIPALL